MDRRRFVKGTAASVSALVGGSGCAPSTGLLKRDLQPIAPDMDEYLTTVDNGLARIDQWSAARVFPSFSGNVDAADSFVRKSFKTLYLTGMFGDLTLEKQQQPGMQDRMWAAMPMMDEAVTETTEFLSAQSESDLEHVRRTLGASDTVGHGIFGMLDDEARRTGVSVQRRQQTSEIFRQINWRLTKQPPALIVNEYLDKVTRLSASNVDLEVQQRWLAAKAGEQAFWQTQQRPSRRQGRISRGGRLMGIGLLVGAASLGLVALSDNKSDVGVGVGLVGVTVGSILILMGFVMLLVGLVTPGEPQSEVSDRGTGTS